MMNNVPKLTKEQAVIITAYTGIGCCKFSDFHKYTEEIMGEPIWTHEFANAELWEQLKEKTKESFLSICAD
jgi:hypothetical protein